MRYKTKFYQMQGNEVIPFMIRSKADVSKIHIAHTNDSSYFTLADKNLMMFGFFAEKYSGYYTYKKNKSHIHALIMDDANTIIGGGHVDDFKLKLDGAKYLYLPACD